MFVRSKEDKKAVFPNFILSSNILLVCSEMKYLGHYISDDLTDDKDIHRQRCKLYAQAHILMRKFHKCSVDVKVSLFKAFCTPLYTAHLWSNYKAHLWSNYKAHLWSNYKAHLWSNYKAHLWSNYKAHLWSNYKAHLWSNYKAHLWSNYKAHLWSNFKAHLWLTTRLEACTN
ncbi:hypothetical protein KUCAC02_018721 [Chaenocephalus aceratus]|uniref:Uncharacterized protein n=1 Tax=Chaenocephalus aceratus TaxID=36190 RepID=A0ACB9W9B0_CHAAC|nr:hypothetical protein KUCAC02_018721 [Chaenocephalus aceratus]